MNATTEKAAEKAEGFLAELRESRAATVVLLVASLVVIGIGVQSQLALNRASTAADNAKDTAQAQHDQLVCVKAWARDFRKVTQKRVDATSELEKAKDHRANALDNIVRVFFMPDSTPQATRQAAFQSALDNYRGVLAHLERVKASVLHTRQHNAYPRLNC